jgi:hypothetical protein
MILAPLKILDFGVRGALTALGYFGDGLAFWRDRLRGGFAVVDFGFAPKNTSPFPKYPEAVMRAPRTPKSKNGQKFACA